LFGELRVSVTDRCNFRCFYCMPDDRYTLVERSELLTYEEIERVVLISTRLGVTKVRLTGGEPLVRKNLAVLVERLSIISEIKDLSITTNGSYLAAQALSLWRAGLKRINVSLDTLDPDKFHRTTKRGRLADVISGLMAAREAGFTNIKLNAVVTRGGHEEDILRLVDFATENRFTIRFIEYMDVGNTNGWASDQIVSKKEIVQIIKTRYRLRELGREKVGGTAIAYELEGAGCIEVIASVTEPFCSDCMRARLTADGRVVTCLFSQQGHDLRPLIRGGATDGEIEQEIRAIWEKREDRYSEKRAEAILSPAGFHTGNYKKIEMIQLGG